MSICILKGKYRERTMSDHLKLHISYGISSMCGKIFKSDERTREYSQIIEWIRWFSLYLFVRMVRRWKQILHLRITIIFSGRYLKNSLVHSGCYYLLNECMVILFVLPPIKTWRMYFFGEIWIKQLSLTPLLWSHILWFNFGRKLVSTKYFINSWTLLWPACSRQGYMSSSGL